MDIPSKIEELIRERERKLPLVSEMKGKIAQAKQVIEKLETICEEAGLDQSDKFRDLFEQNPDIAEDLRLINTKQFNGAYDEAVSLLNKLEDRFSRKEIHISFVGRARQGKSLVMQSISGLSGDIIPASDGADCTGTKSVIINKDVTEVTAEINFYTREEYLEIVNKYMKEIFEDKNKLLSVEEISKLPVVDLRNQIDTTSAKKLALFEQLIKYIEHSEELIPLLGMKKNVPAMDIEKYVAQYSCKDKTQKYFSYLAVKVANIMCKFPCEQSGKIMLVDTIGLGDTAIDIRERMLETVGKDSDAIILMTRPDSKGQKLEQDDIDIVDSISKKMTAAYTKQLLFWILNKVSSGVGKNVDGLAEIQKRIKTMTENNVTADCMIIDCFDRTDVEENMLIPILNRLSTGLPITDELMINEAADQIKVLYQEYHDIAEKVGKALLATIDLDTKREFRSEINKTYNRMTNSIRNLYLDEPYGKLRKNACEVLKKAAEQKLLNIFKNIPEKEEILDYLNNGTINQHNAYERLTDRIRLNIINDFLELNVVLHELVVQMKNNIIHCLADENEGRLMNVITESVENVDEWLQELISKFKSENKYELICEALEQLLKFDLRMESFLIYRVRGNLDTIDISLSEQPPEIRGSLAEKDKIASDIVSWLEHNLETVYKNIKEDFKTLYNYPNTALWAVVKDFYDRIVYASKGDFTVERAWEYFYEDNISFIWKDKYGEYQAKKSVSQYWDELINEIRKYDNKKQFCFMSKEV